MRIYTCNAFTGYWPVGTAAIVRAKSQEEAAEKLNEELRLCRLPEDATPESMKEFKDDDEVRILCDGNY